MPRDQIVPGADTRNGWGISQNDTPQIKGWLPSPGSCGFARVIVGNLELTEGISIVTATARGRDWEISTSRRELRPEPGQLPVFDSPTCLLPPEPWKFSLATPGRGPARIALETRAVPNQREVQALAAHLALIALRLGFGAAFGGDGFGVGLRPLQLLECLCRRELLLGLGFQRGRAGDFPRGVAEESDVTLETAPPRPASPADPPPAGEDEVRSAPPCMTFRRSVRERVRPLET